MTKRGEPAPGWVYVMESGGIYKVGFSQNVPKRLSMIKGSSPLPVTLIGVVEGTRDDEASWHRAFIGKRVHGEWFSLNQRDIDYILHETEVDELPDDDHIA